MTASVAKAKSSPGKTRKVTPQIARAMLARLAKLHPDAHCELDHKNPFELLVATVLSAQTTDVAVNKATPAIARPITRCCSATPASFSKPSPRNNTM